MRVKEVVESHVGDTDLGFFESDDCYRVICDDESIKAAAKKLKCSEELVEFLMDAINSLNIAIQDDLKDVWNEVQYHKEDGH